MLSFGKKQDDKDLICCLQNGDPIVPATVTKHFQKITEAAGYKITFHQLRYAHASYLLKQGVHPKVVAERLRHANISMTMNLYSHRADTLTGSGWQPGGNSLLKKSEKIMLPKCYRNRYLSKRKRLPNRWKPCYHWCGRKDLNLHGCNPTGS